MILPWQGFWSGGEKQGSLIHEANLQFPQETVWASVEWEC